MNDIDVVTGTAAVDAIDAIASAAPGTGTGAISLILLLSQFCWLFWAK